MELIRIFKEMVIDYDINKKNNCNHAGILLAYLLCGWKHDAVIKRLFK